MVKIPLWRKGKVVAQAIVDDQDAHLAEHHWTCQRGRYGVRAMRVGGKVRTLYLHREVLGLKPGSGLEADHINHDTLDNRRANLQAISHLENMRRRRPFRRSNQHIAARTA